MCKIGDYQSYIVLYRSCFFSPTTLTTLIGDIPPELPLASLNGLTDASKEAGKIRNPPSKHQRNRISKTVVNGNNAGTKLICVEEMNVEEKLSTVVKAPTSTSRYDAHGVDKNTPLATSGFQQFKLKHTPIQQSIQQQQQQQQQQQHQHNQYLHHQLYQQQQQQQLQLHLQHQHDIVTAYRESSLGQEGQDWHAVMVSGRDS